jgi:hypothetical protein
MRYRYYICDVFTDTPNIGTAFALATAGAFGEINGSIGVTWGPERETRGRRRVTRLGGSCVLVSEGSIEVD